MAPDLLVSLRMLNDAVSMRNAARAGVSDRGAIAASAGKGYTVPPFPPVVYVEPTNACNCDCSICPRQNMKRAVGQMNMMLFKKIIDECARWRPQIRLFNFGEPMLNEHLCDMLKYARACGLQTNFQTNGLLLSRGRIEELLDAGTDYMGVSVNGLTETEYGMIRPGYSLGDMKASVRVLRETAKARGARLHIHVNAQIVEDERDARRDDVSAFVRYWEGIPDSMSVSGMSLFDGISIPRSGCLQKVAIRDLHRKSDSQVVCSEPFDRLVIKWDGSVTACCADYDARCVFGNVQSESLSSMWQGGAINELRAAVTGRHYSESALCRDCPKLYSKEFTLLFKKGPAD